VVVVIKNRSVESMGKRGSRITGCSRLGSQGPQNMCTAPQILQ